MDFSSMEYLWKIEEDQAIKMKDEDEISHACDVITDGLSLII